MTMIRLDVSSTSVVVTCASCATWYGFAFTRLEALRAAARHEERVHPLETDARSRLFKFEKRHAA